MTANSIDMNTRTLLGIALNVLICTSPLRASAQDFKGKALKEFDAAEALRKADKCAEAIPHYEASLKLEPGLGKQFYLAQCLEAVGRFSSAWTGYREVENKAKAAGETPKSEAAHARAEAVAPKIDHIKLVIADPGVPGLVVQLAGRPIDSSDWADIPIDPGTYAVTATAPGRTPWTGSVTIAGASDTEVVNVPRLVGAGGDVSVVSPVSVLPAGGSSSTTYTSGSRRTIALITGGVGVVLAGTGVALGLAAHSKYSGASCSGGSPNICQDYDGAKSAFTMANVGTGIIVAGAGAIAAGVVLWVTAPSSHPDASNDPSVALAVGPGTMFVKGAF